MKLNRTNVKDASRAPERIIQFGEGNFLRAFVDWMIQEMNDKADFNSSVVVVQPIEKGMCDILTAQNCRYTHIIRGEEGVETSVIDVISRCVKPYEDFEGFLNVEFTRFSIFSYASIVIEAIS